MKSEHFVFRFLPISKTTENTVQYRPFKGAAESSDADLGVKQSTAVNRCNPLIQESLHRSKEQSYCLIIEFLDYKQAESKCGS